MPETQLAVELGTTVGERRAGRRFKLRLPCHVSSPQKRFRDLTGTTSDISRSGVLVELDESCASPEGLPDVGEIAKVVIDLPHSPNISPRQLECMTWVVRVIEGETGPPFVAFEIGRVRVQDRGTVQTP